MQKPVLQNKTGGCLIIHQYLWEYLVLYASSSSTLVALAVKVAKSLKGILKMDSNYFSIADAIINPSQECFLGSPLLNIWLGCHSNRSYENDKIEKSLKY